jgi:hypothetical protein
MPPTEGSSAAAKHFETVMHDTADIDAVDGDTDPTVHRRSPSV